MIGFERQRSYLDTRLKNATLAGLTDELTAEQATRFRQIRRNWDFYEGYHWEELPEQEGIEVTVNYCRAFIDKFVAFELGKGFTTQLKKNVADLNVGNGEELTLTEFLDSVWKDNDKYLFCTELGQMKSITGEAWIQIGFEAPGDFEDAFSEYPDGRIKLKVMPTEVVFPTYDPHNRGVLQSVSVIYRYERKFRVGVMHKLLSETATFRQIWTADEVVTYDGTGNDPITEPNRYGFIPFVQINNLPISCRNGGRSDLEDIIPLNVEYNMKESDVSEIIAYHAAPVTVVYGAKVGNLEKGANKMWGGLSKDARVENLTMNTDLGASNAYIGSLKLSMCEVAGIPEAVLGGSQGISNTSGVALQYMNLPLIEKTRFKRNATETGLEKLNKMILVIGLLEGIIHRPDGVSNRDFFWNEVTLPDTLPKDTLLELQAIQQEMLLGLESRHGAMERLGKENISELLAEIEEERRTHPEFYDGDNALDSNKGNVKKINSGATNSQTAIEEVRKEMTGKNGGAE